jgi:hypothetical protein
MCHQSDSSMPDTLCKAGTSRAVLLFPVDPFVTTCKKVMACPGSPIQPNQAATRVLFLCSLLISKCVKLKKPK